MKGLNNLPSEVLCLITRSLEAQETTKLLLSGDLKLRSRLERGGVTFLAFLSEQSSENAFKYCLQRWPSLLSRFRCLETLIIDLGHHYQYGTLVVHHLDLNFIPTTIKHLELHFDLHPSSFCIDEEPKKASSYAETSSSSSRRTRANPWIYSRIFERLERLHTLILVGNHKMYAQEGIKWPSQLTHLRIESEPDTGEICNWSFPDTLTSLELDNLRLVAMNFVERLPRGLLHLIVPKLQVAESSWFQQLPTSIETLRMDVSNNLEPVSIILLPPGLTSLVSQKLHCFVPSHLSTCFLPRIRKLQIHSIQEEGTNVSIWPPNLVHLTTRAISKSDRPLPSSLRSLINYSPYLHTLLMLPSTMTCLRIGTVPAEYWHALPRSLIELHSIANTQSADLSLLPPHLSKLSVYRTPFTSQTIALLPTTLISLHINLNTERTPVQQYELEVPLPQNIRTFIYCGRLTGPSFIFPDNMDTLRLLEYPHSIKSLPTSLTYLDLHYSGTEATLPQLPAGLLHLSIASSSSSRQQHEDASWIKKLPISLRSLSIDAPVHIDDIPFLPPHITRLQARFETNLQEIQAQHPTISMQDLSGIAT